MAESDFLEGKMPVHLEGLELPLEYLRKQKDDVFKDGTLTCLAESGLMLASKEALSLGTELHVKLHLPKPLLSDSQWQMVPLDAKVVWIDDLLGVDEVRHYGTQFMEVPEKERHILKQYLKLRCWMKDKILDQ
jgi:hypothetical protein